MRRRLSRIEQRITRPYVIDFLNPQMWMLEQVRCLRVDLERILHVQEVQIETLLASHVRIVLQTDTGSGRLEQQAHTQHLGNADPNEYEQDHYAALNREPHPV